MIFNHLEGGWEGQNESVPYTLFMVKKTYIIYSWTPSTKVFTTCKGVTNQNCSNTELVLRGTMFQQELIFCMLLTYQIISHGSCIEGIEPFSDTEVAPLNNGKCENCLEAPRKPHYAEYKARKLVPISLENTAYIRSHPVLVAKRSFACLRQCLRVGNLHPAQCHSLCFYWFSTPFIVSYHKEPPKYISYF